MTLYTLAESNMRKTWLYLGFFLALVLFLGWIVSLYFESPFIFWISFLVSVLASLGSFWYSDKIVLAMSRAQPIEKKDNPELYRLVENLCITAGLPLPKIYIIDSSAPNAFATGRNPQHAVIAVTSGLLEKLERVELEGVIAHELAHVGNRDALLATIIVVLVGLVIRVADLFFRSGFKGRQNREEKGSPVLAILGILFLILAPFLAQMVRFAISRKREFLADATGALLTRYPEGLARALEKIASSPVPLRVASNATAHLYIVSPFKGRQTQNWLIKLFSTHPPIEERIRALREMKV
jgi:heat shock protein HtpX